MSCSRRDFFSRIVAACLSVLGWRPRPADAAPVLLGPARATSVPLAEFSHDGPTTVHCYDAAGRLLDTYIQDPPYETQPGELVDSGDGYDSARLSEVVSYSCDGLTGAIYTYDGVTGKLLDPPDRNDA